MLTADAPPLRFYLLCPVLEVPVCTPLLVRYLSAHLRCTVEAHDCDVPLLQAHNRLAKALCEMGQFEKAVHHLRAVGTRARARARARARVQGIGLQH